MSTVAGPNYRAFVDRKLPRALEQAVADAHTFFEQELPAVLQWRLSEEEARRLRQPVLAVMGALSPDVSPIWQQRQDLLKSWLPNVEAFVLPNATHLLHLQNPQGLADRLALFFTQHPIAPSSKNPLRPDTPGN